MQLIHSAFTLLAGRLKNASRGAANAGSALRARHQQRKHNGCRMRHDHRAALSAIGQHGCAAQFAVHPRRAHLGSGLLLERVRNVNNGAAGVARHVPMRLRERRL